MARWPWASRLAYDLAVARAEQAERRAEASDTRYHELVERIGKQERLPAAVDPKPQPPDLVMMAVGQQGARDPALGRYLAAYVAMERAKQMAGQQDAKGDPILLEEVTHWVHRGSDGVPDGFWPEQNGDSGSMS